MTGSAMAWAASWARRLMLGTVALALVGGLGSSGCGEEEPDAVRAAKEFTQALRAGDADRVLSMVDDQTATRVTIAAERASDQVGGRRSIEPEEMFQVIAVDPRFQVASAELVSDSGDQAIVQLTGADGTTHALTMVLEDGSWRVRLSLPADPMANQ